MVKGTFWKICKKNCHISRKKVIEIVKIFGGFGQFFLAFEIAISSQ